MSGALWKLAHVTGGIGTTIVGAALFYAIATDPATTPAGLAIGAGFFIVATSFGLLFALDGFDDDESGEVEAEAGGTPGEVSA